MATHFQRSCLENPKDGGACGLPSMGSHRVGKHLNAEFQRIAKRDKKDFSVINAKKEENNRMGKTRDLFKKIRDTKGTFHAKMGSIKDRNGMDRTRRY